MVGLIMYCESDVVEKVFKHKSFLNFPKFTVIMPINVNCVFSVKVKDTFFFNLF